MTASGALAVAGCSVRTAVGSRFVPATVIEVLAEPDKAFAALKLTLKVPVSLAIGVQLRVPVVFPEPGVNTAWFPAGSPVRSAAREVMTSPCGARAETLAVAASLNKTLTEVGAV